MPGRWLRHRLLGSTATPGCAGDGTATGGAKKHRQECLCHGGSLRAVERVEETGEDLGVGLEIFRHGRISDHVAHHIGLAVVLRSVEEEIVNVDVRSP
jgi:hypothetical protein